MEIDPPEQDEEREKKGKGKAVKKVEAKVGGKRFEIKKWNAVAMWSWAISTDTCAICRNNLYEPSIEYQVILMQRFQPVQHSPGLKAEAVVVPHSI